MIRIRQLPQDVANQIAAGEVVERPASVIKELVENAVDAKASKIHIDIEEGGIQLIRVRDDGCGIVKEDIALSVKAHATSKIKCAEELLTVNSLGFRGEALASISAVSQCRITTKTKEARHAYSIEVNGGIASELTEAAHPTGTSIEVRELFYNVPVRRKFLKSKKVEFAHIETIVKRMALSQFGVAFYLSHNGKRIYQLPSCHTEDKKIDRVARIFGKSFTSNHLKVKGEAVDMSLHGFICDKDFMRSQNDLQYLYLNGRMIKDKLILHAIRSVYQPLLHPGRQACFLLYLDMPRHLYDINVHPAKHEVRFVSPRQVYDFIISSLNQVLRMDDNQQTYIIKENDKEASIKAKQFDDGLMPKEKPLSSINNGKIDFVLLGGHFGLVTLGDKHCVFDYMKLYRQNLTARIKKELARHALSSRPLLMPISITMDEKSLIDYPFHMVARFGLQISQINSKTLLVREIPILMPHLNIQLAVMNLIGVTTFDEVMEKMVQAQSVDYAALSEYERNDIVRYLLEQLNRAKKVKSTYRLFKKDDWAKIINA